MIEILNIPLWVAAYFWRKKNELHFTDIVLIFFSYPWLYNFSFQFVWFFLILVSKCIYEIYLQNV
jgi:hypothetical protein